MTTSLEFQNILWSAFGVEIHEEPPKRTYDVNIFQPDGSQAGNYSFDGFGAADHMARAVTRDNPDQHAQVVSGTYGWALLYAEGTCVGHQEARS